MIYQDFSLNLPKHLNHFCVPQNYAKYTSLNQASWRFIMKQHREFLGKHAHSSYLNGLKKTGIGIDKIPSIEEMNQKLSELGWRAVIVDGFVPPSIFMEFNAHKILPIAADIRTFEHILYTPAPDIVHEAAGHAPIIADPLYADYLQKIGEIGAKALYHKKDFEVYEAIRFLSMIKEFPNASFEEINKAQENLEKKVKENTFISEATLISRLHWWTVEYGLVGELENPQIYGAGLLSSLSESRSCLGPEVRKIPLSLDCIQYSYDVTRPQAQLFVAKNFEQLFEVLEELSSTLSYKVGGKIGLKRAQESENWATLELSSGLQISGVLKSFVGEGDFVQFFGPTSLSFNHKELPGHHTKTHFQGFSSPLGVISGFSKPLENHSRAELSRLGLDLGNKIQLQYQSGMKVSGRVKELLYREEKLLVISLVEARVESNRGEILYSSPGVYDLAVGQKVLSVFSGPADRQAHSELFRQSENKTYHVQYSSRQQKIYQLFDRLRLLRDANELDLEKYLSIYRDSLNEGSNWLLKMELLEMMNSENFINNLEAKSLSQLLVDELNSIAKESSEKKLLIDMGLALQKRN